jgi:hypothetical protein
MYSLVYRKVSANVTASLPIQLSLLVVVFSLSIWEVESSSPTRAGSIKPKTFKIGSDSSFAKSTTFRSDNHGSFGYDVENGSPVSHIKALSLLKPVSAKHMSKFAALSPVVVTVAR